MDDIRIIARHPVTGSLLISKPMWIPLANSRHRPRISHGAEKKARTVLAVLRGEVTIA